MILAACLLSLAVAPSADAVLNAALTEAKKLRKNAFVDFGASWCPWCRRTEKLLEEPAFAEKFKASYVFAKITVREREDKRANENAGWEPLMVKYRKSKDRDIPYFVILDPEGKKLGDSYRPPVGDIPGNAGYPKSKEEIDAFLTLLKATGKAFNAEDLKSLQTYFAKP